MPYPMSIGGKHKSISSKNFDNKNPYLVSMHTCTQKAEQIIVTDRSYISVVYYQEIHQHPSDNVSITRDLYSLTLPIKN